MPHKDHDARKAYAREHYARNKDVYKARARAFTDQARIRNSRFVRTYLEGHPCEHCSETDPVVLQFHHHDSESKYRAVADLVRSGHSIKVIQAEIDKCIVLCANCHARVTAKELGYYAWLEEDVT